MSKAKLIAKNTLMLYFRQILIMLVSLYTVRVVLNVLGAEDYGIYNVVAGVVVLFSFVNNAMASGTQRFLNYSLGENDLKKTQDIYSASLLIHLSISIFFIILAETAGLWFVSNKLNIPENRLSVAVIAYQFSVATCVFNILKVPYNAVIIAYEKMSFFAWISIIEAILKLSVTFIISFVKFDKLVFYSFLLSCISFIIALAYKFFCNKEFEIAHFKKVSDKGLIKNLISFSGWNLFGATANMCNTQGTNIVLNIFTNVTVNAAMGIANQVNTAVYSFVSNFQTAFNPQIVKSWASKDYDFFHSLLIKSSKYSFYLLYIIVLPLWLNADFILSFWLKNVPDYAVSFVRLILIWSLVESINGPLYMAAHATGNIKLYQIVIGIINLFNLPLVIIAFIFGANPYWLFYIRIALNVFALFFRVEFCARFVLLSRKNFIKNVIARILLVALPSAAITFFIGKLVSGLVYFFVTCFVSVFLTFLLILFAGLTPLERKSVFVTIKEKVLL